MSTPYDPCNKANPEFDGTVDDANDNLNILWSTKEDCTEDVESPTHEGRTPKEMDMEQVDMVHEMAMTPTDRDTYPNPTFFSFSTFSSFSLFRTILCLLQLQTRRVPTNDMLELFRNIRARFSQIDTSLMNALWNYIRSEYRHIMHRFDDRRSIEAIVNEIKLRFLNNAGLQITHGHPDLEGGEEMYTYSNAQRDPGLFDFVCLFCMTF